jgi:arylsulfatase A-like enzyme
MNQAITRRSFLKIGAASAVLAKTGRVDAADPPDDRLNLLFIMTDQQRADTISALGNSAIDTPALDSLVSRGVSFRQCHATSPVCSPSRSTLQTGRWPHSTGVLANDMELPDNETTLGEILSAAGYESGYVGKWHLGKSNQKRQGYDFVEPFTADYLEWLRARDPSAEWGEDRRMTGPYVGYSVLPESHHRTQYLTDRAIDYLRSRSGSPFALFVSLYPPHFPLCPPRPWDQKYDPASLALPLNHVDRLEGKPDVQKRYRFCLGNKPARMLTPPQWRDLIAHYYGMVSYVDGQIGRLLRSLEELGLRERTLIVFTSDHGDMTSAHQMVWKGPYMYDEVVKVPLVLSCAALRDRLLLGRRIDSLVSLIDLPASILSLLGVSIPPGVQGRSGLLAPKEAVFAEYYAMNKRDLPSERDTRAIFEGRLRSMAKMVRTERWKYSWRPFDLDELYDLDADPGELANLALDPAQGGRIKTLRMRIQDWMRETDDPLTEMWTA